MQELLQRGRDTLNDPTVGEDLAQLGREISAKKHSIDALVDAVEQEGWIIYLRAIVRA